MRIEQLDLWSGPQPVLGIGDTFEVMTSWANGDTSPMALQRLADVLRGTRYVSPWQVKPIVWGWYRETRVEGDHVAATVQITASPYQGVLDGDEEVCDSL